MSCMNKRFAGLRSNPFCPECRSDALYRYGKDHVGRQRVMCIVCGRQFVPGHTRLLVNNRPVCPQCGENMHLYRREDSGLRFRCSAYPGCRSYIKFNTQEVAQRGFLRA